MKITEIILLHRVCGRRDRNQQRISNKHELQNLVNLGNYTSLNMKNSIL